MHNGVNNRRFHLAAALLGMAALALRVWRIDVQELWLDEALTAYLAQSSDWLGRVHNTPPLYFLLMRGWARFFGLDALGLRLFSAVSGALFVWVTPYAARRAFGARAGLLAGLLALVSPIQIYYSQEARAYSLLTAELMFVFWMLWRMKGGGGLATRILLWFGTVSALFTHYLSVIPVGLAFLLVGFSKRDDDSQPGWRAFAAVGAPAVLCLGAWVAWWRGRTSFRPDDMEWLRQMWGMMPGIGSIPMSLQLFGTGMDSGVAPVFAKQLSDLAFPYAAKAAALAALALVSLAGIAGAGSDTTRRRRAMIQCMLLTIGPLLCLWAISLRKPVYCPWRYDIIAFPAFVLFSGYAASRAIETAGTALRRAGVVALMLVFVGVVAWKDVLYFRAGPSTAAYARAGQQLNDGAGNGDLVVLVGPIGLPVMARLYPEGWSFTVGACENRAAGRRFECRMLPRGLESAPAAVARYDRAVRGKTLPDDLRGLLGQHPRSDIVWLVLSETIGVGGEKFFFDDSTRGLLEVLREEGYKVAGIDARAGLVRLTKTRAAGSWKFVSIPDFLNVDTEFPQPGWEDALDFILGEVKGENPDFVLVPGDLVGGRWLPAEQIGPCAEHYYDAWKARMAGHGLRFYAGIGDHEIGDLPGPEEAARCIHIYKEQFRKSLGMPLNGPPGMKGTAFYFVHKKTLFVFVDVFQSSPGGNGVEVTVGPDELAWFERVVAGHAGVDHVIVLGHTPVFGPVDAEASSGLMLDGREKSPFWLSMVSNRTDIYLCGEVHTVNCMEKDGLMQVTHGSLLGALSNANYLVCTVSGSRAEVEIRQIPIANMGKALPQAGAGQWRPHSRVEISDEDRERGFTSVGRLVLDKASGRPVILERTGCFLPRGGE